MTKAVTGKRNKMGPFDVVNAIIMLFLVFITLYPFYHIGVRFVQQQCIAQRTQGSAPLAEGF